VTTFDDLNQDENTNPLSLFLTPPGATPIFNFALARVHMQAQVDATVRVFFRSFRASVTTSSYDPVNMLSEASTFRSNPPPLALPGPGDSRIPLLGVGPVTDANGQTVNEYVTIPFFATVRKQIDPVNPGPMLDQQDIPNVIPIPGSPNSAPTQTFFGCWLDINRPTPLFPIQVPASPSDWDGPFTSGALPILQAFTYDLHQCLVAEISYDGINIPPGETPASSAWLAQRNLGFTQS
jgi:hypothetical protein